MFVILKGLSDYVFFSIIVFPISKIRKNSKSDTAIVK